MPLRGGVGGHGDVQHKAGDAVRCTDDLQCGGIEAGSLCFERPRARKGCKGRAVPLDRARAWQFRVHRVGHRHVGERPPVRGFDGCPAGVEGHRKHATQFSFSFADAHGEVNHDGRSIPHIGGNVNACSEHSEFVGLEREGVLFLPFGVLNTRASPRAR